MRRSASVSAWLLATALTTGLAFWAVSAASSEVTDRPLTAIVASPVTADTPAITVAPVTSSAPVVTVTPSAAVATEASPSTVEWQQYTLNSAGGSLIVSYRPNEVRLESATPAAGFTFEIDDQGPQRVEVEFEGEDVRYTLRAEWTSEGFSTRVDSSGEGD